MVCENEDYLKSQLKISATSISHFIILDINLVIIASYVYVIINTSNGQGMSKKPVEVSK